MSSSSSLPLDVMRSAEMTRFNSNFAHFFSTPFFINLSFIISTTATALCCTSSLSTYRENNFNGVYETVPCSGEDIWPRFGVPTLRCCKKLKPFLLHLHFFPVDARAEVKRYSSLLASPPAYISE